MDSSRKGDGVCFGTVRELGALSATGRALFSDSVRDCHKKNIEPLARDSEILAILRIYSKSQTLFAQPLSAWQIRERSITSLSIA